MKSQNFIDQCIKNFDELLQKQNLLDYRRPLKQFNIDLKVTERYWNKVSLKTFNKKIQLAADRLIEHLKSLPDEYEAYRPPFQTHLEIPPNCKGAIINHDKHAVRIVSLLDTEFTKYNMMGNGYDPQNIVIFRFDLLFYE